jgi:hypothetical protein
MSVDGSLLSAPSREEMARHHQFLSRTAIALAARIAEVFNTSRLFEDQLGDAHRFLASYESPPAKQLHEKLSRIQQLVTMTEAAVDMHENAALTFSANFVAKHPTSKAAASSDNRRPAILRPTYHRAAGTRPGYQGLLLVRK